MAAPWFYLCSRDAPCPADAVYRVAAIRTSARGSPEKAGRRGRIRSSSSPRSQAGQSVLLIAPTGAGKTLAGFLPSLVDLVAARPREASSPKPGEPVIGPHTLYVSPLKALAVDIQRNLEIPVGEMGLPIRIETRTGDTPLHKRQRQKLDPPDILLTTPEQVALLIASKDARRFFARLTTVIFDELHSLVVSKRGDLLALGLARLRQLAPGLKTIGLVRHRRGAGRPARLAGGAGAGRAAPALRPDRGGRRRGAGTRDPRFRGPHSVAGPYGTLCAAGGLRGHQGAPDDAPLRQYALAGRTPVQRTCGPSTRTRCPSRCTTARWTAASAGVWKPPWRPGELRAVVATSTLDLGIDWGDVDLVIHVGAPKGASRLAQRIGRANHRMDEPSKGILVPANRFEVLECRAALDANYLGHQDTPPLRAGRARRALPAYSRHGGRGAVRRRGALCRNHGGGILPRSPLGDVRARRRFRRDRRLCATHLRALRQDPPPQGRAAERPVGHLASRRRAAVPAEYRHHRRSADAEGACSADRARVASYAAGACSARSRSIFWRCSARATPSSSPDRSCASRAFARTSPTPPRRSWRTRRSPPMPAESSRSPPIWRRRCAPSSPTLAAGRRCRRRCANG